MWCAPPPRTSFTSLTVTAMWSAFTNLRCCMFWHSVAKLAPEEKAMLYRLFPLDRQGRFDLPLEDHSTDDDEALTFFASLPETALPNGFEIW